ncbi:MAG: phage head closure protein [Giesbergeria sp.]|nr:phage head closure protein [Giesbergeria sp.]
MKAGQLDQRVTLERLSGGVDELGQPIESWAPLFTCWAAVEPLTGREFLAAQAAVSEVTARIRMRYRPGVLGTDRVIHGSTTYGIEAAIDLRSGNRELVLMCKAVG